MDPADLNFPMLETLQIFPERTIDKISLKDGKTIAVSCPEGKTYVKCAEIQPVQLDGQKFRYFFQQSENTNFPERTSNDADFPASASAYIQSLKLSIDPCKKKTCDLTYLLQAYQGYYTPIIQKIILIKNPQSETYENILKSAVHSKTLDKIFIREEDELLFTCQGGFSDPKGQNVPNGFNTKSSFKAKCHSDGQILYYDETNDDDTNFVLMDLKQVRCKVAQVATDTKKSIKHCPSTFREIAPQWINEDEPQLRNCITSGTSTLWTSYEIFGSSIGWKGNNGGNVNFVDPNSDSEKNKYPHEGSLKIVHYQIFLFTRSLQKWQAEIPIWKAQRKYKKFCIGSSSFSPLQLSLKVSFKFPLKISL